MENARPCPAIETCEVFKTWRRPRIQQEEQWGLSGTVILSSSSSSSSYSLLIGSKYRTRLVFKRQDDLAVLYMCFSLSLSSFSRLLIHLAVGCITSWKGKKKEEKRAPADDKKTSQTRVKSLGKVSSPPTSLSFFYFFIFFLSFLSGDLFFFIHWKTKMYICGLIENGGL